MSIDILIISALPIHSRKDSGQRYVAEGLSVFSTRTQSLTLRDGSYRPPKFIQTV